jgi:nicotinamidase/pyrazinamidase
VNALILVDLQYDFMPGGALAVPRGDELVVVANGLMGRFDLVVATRDWHPADHGSFASQHPGREPGDVIELDGVEQVLWPDHCIQRTRGAELHEGLDARQVDHVVYKGSDRSVDSYSAFFDNARKRSTGLADELRKRGADTVHLMGLATDYCVKFSALDAVDLGLRTFVLRDGCRGIDLHPGDVQRAWDEMRAAGVTVIDSAEAP